MTDTDQLLNTLKSIDKRLDGLEQGQRRLETEQQAQGKDIKTLKEDVKTVDLKVAASHEFNKNAHAEIMETLLDISEINYHELKKEIADLKKRMEQLEGKRHN